MKRFNFIRLFPQRHLRWSANTALKFNRSYSNPVLLAQEVRDKLGDIADFENDHEKKTVDQLAGSLSGEEDQFRNLVKQISKHESLSEDSKHLIMNEILSSVLSHDFSLYYHVPENHQWSRKAIKTLIHSNPGRAVSTWELLERHAIDPDDALLEILVDKAFFGERYEREESEDVEFSGMHIYKALSLFRRINDPTKTVVDLILLTLIEQDALCVLRYANLDTAVLKKKLEEDMSPVAYLRIFTEIFKTDPNFLSSKELSKAFLCCYESNTPHFQAALTRDEKSCKQLDKFFDGELDHVDTLSIMKNVVDHVTGNNLDCDVAPDSLLLRLEMMRAYGIYLDDISTALAKFHHYQTHCKFGIEFVQLNLQQAFCFQAVKHENLHYLKVAETLITPEHIAVTSLKHLILARSEFDVNTSLQLYNDYIQKVSKKINSTTNRSPAGQLTEALMLAYLYNNDREFAHVICDGAITLQTVVDEHEIAKLQNLFKVYGDAWKDDNWEAARPLLKQTMLSHIRQ